MGQTGWFTLQDGCKRNAQQSKPKRSLCDIASNIHEHNPKKTKLTCTATPCWAEMDRADSVPEKTLTRTHFNSPMLARDFSQIYESTNLLSIRSELRISPSIGSDVMSTEQSSQSSFMSRSKMN